MIFLLPLGLLALLSIVLLIVIYILKPPYQNKMVTSSYLWNESLKFRKKRLPVSKFKQFMTLICQVLVLALAACIIANPMLQLSTDGVSESQIIIIDGSANMLANNGEDTRFERAVESARDIATSAINNLETVTIIMADEEANYLCINSNSISSITASLDELLLDVETSCSFQDGDVETAMNLASSSILDDMLCDIHFITATNYNNVGEVNVVDVSSEDDYNATIKSVKKEMVDNYYQFTVEVAVYGKDESLVVSLDAEGVNDDMQLVYSDSVIYCSDNLTYTVVFKDLGIYAFDSIRFGIASFEGNEDSFSYDNEFYLYGGRKEVIDILYCSTASNIFFMSVLGDLQSYYYDDVTITITQSEDPSANLSGFDYYIFEHTMPTFVPNDGVSFLINPNTIPTNLDVALSSVVEGDFSLDSNVAHSLLTYITASNIELTSYKRMTNIGDYTSILQCNGDNVLIAQNTDTTKVAIMSFSLNESNMAIGLSFPLLMLNMYNYFLPQTLSSYSYDAGEDVAITARGSDLQISYKDVTTPYENSATYVFDEIGTYTITQTLLSGEESTTSFFVGVPSSQCDFTIVIEEIAGLFELEKPETSYQDMLVWLALLLVVFLFLERWLFFKEET